VSRLRGVIIEQGPALDLIEKMDGLDSLFYVDPPYLPETRDDARADYRHELTPADHDRLAEVLRGLQGKVILSGYASQAYEDLYRGWHRAEIPALADGGRPRTEVLWMNFQPAQEVMAL
jgi:DNA adenine methylase